MVATHQDIGADQTLKEFDALQFLDLHKLKVFDNFADAAIDNINNTVQSPSTGIVVVAMWLLTGAGVYKYSNDWCVAQLFSTHIVVGILCFIVAAGAINQVLVQCTLLLGTSWLLGRIRLATRPQRTLLLPWQLA